MKRVPVGVALATAGVLGGFVPPSYADDACATFKWDVAQERTLFAGTSQPMIAARDTNSAPVLLPARLYALSLAPQTQVELAVPPGRKANAEGAFAGLAHLKVTVPGLYRISLDQSGWIDVAGERGVIAASDFSGAAGCSAPHKVVQFELPAGELVLQLSGVASALIKLAITAIGGH
jgi:hypothetical protein